MNTFQKLLIALFLINSSLFAASKSIFVPRSTTRDSTLELAQANYFFYHNEGHFMGDSPWVYFFFEPFVQRSFNSRRLAEYFLVGNQSSISVREDGLGDVNPVWFGLIAPAGASYSSTYQIRPVRTAYGAYFNFYFDLCKGFWAGIEFVAMGVNHKLRPCETVTTGAADPANNFGTLPNIRTFSDALSNSDLCAGRFSKCSLNRGGLDDIQVKLGYNGYFRESDHVGGYLVLNIPTGKRQTAEYIFEPLVGSKNAGFGAGLNADFNLYDRTSHSLNWMFDFKYLYMFGSKQCRIPDLCANGDWSRYLQVVADPATPLLTTFGSCLFRQKFKVKPGSEINFWTALHFERCLHHFEVGYNLWWRDREKICQLCVDPVVGVADIANFVACQGISASGANISQAVDGSNLAVTDAAFTNIGNFNLDSARVPTALTHKLYASYAYDYSICSRPAMVGITAACEFATGCYKRNALEQWQLFLTLGMTY